MTKQDAFARLEAFKAGIPFEAIRFLYNCDPDPEILGKIRFALEHAFDEELYLDSRSGEYCHAPLWYAIVAEKHTDLSLLDPLIRIYTEYDEEYDFLLDQGGFLLEKMFDEYGDQAVRPAMEAIDRMMQNSSHRPYLHLFASLHYADAGYADKVISWLDNPNNYWLEAMISHIGDAPQFSEALPTLRRMLARYESELSGLPDRHPDRHILIELEGTIKDLESGKPSDNPYKEPFFKWRKPWDEYYARFKGDFEYEKPVLSPQKTAKVGRNDPCPCGSGKKYKKCCWGKGVFE